MKLTQSEMRFVNKWQKHERWWPKTRWLCLLASGGLTATWAVLIHRIRLLPVESSEELGAVAWLSQICWILLFFSAGWLGLTLAHWRGHMKTRLLLKLIEEYQSKDD